MDLKPQDVVIILKLVVSKDKTYSELAAELGMSASTVHDGVKRSAEAGLLDLADGVCARIRSKALYYYLIHGVPHSFYVKPGAITHGMPTAHAATPLSSLINSGDALPPVWPDPDGEIRGYELKPLYKSVPKAARNDPFLYELLALVDALRAGRVREKKLAAEILRKRLYQVRKK